MTSDQSGLRTGVASNITDSTALLNGSFNPYYVPVGFSEVFEYGTTTSYGQTITAYQSSTVDISLVSGDLTGLTPSTTYHYRLRLSPTNLGSDLTFTTAEKGNKGIIFNNNVNYGSVSDISGNVYKTVTIGTQTWMAENLKTTRFSDGSQIRLISDGQLFETSTEAAYCFYNNDKPIYNPIYGALYNWYAVSTSKLCPTGWHVSTDDDWTTLGTFLGGDNLAGTKLTESGVTHWQLYSGSGNESGFTALPGGSITDGLFYNIGWEGKWWTSTEFGTQSAYDREMIHINNTAINRNQALKSTGFSVRCVKD
jgi:uncharacterized protein (TIGR02145 family)